MANCSAETPHFWLNGLPAEICPHSIYFIKNGENVEMYVSDANGNTHLINVAVASLIHNLLDGLQGGQAGQYYHLTLSQYNSLVDLIGVEYGSGLRNDEGVIKLGANPEIPNSPGAITENTLLIRTNDPAVASTSILLSDEYNEDGDPVVTNIQTVVFDGEDVYSSYINSQISNQDDVITPEANIIITTPQSSKGIMVSSALEGIVVSDGIDEKGLVGEAYFGDNATDNTYIQKKYVDDLVQSSVSPSANQMTRIRKGWQWNGAIWVFNTSDSNEKGDIFSGVLLDVGTNIVWYYPHTRWNGTGDVNDITNHSWGERFNMPIVGEPTF